MKEKSGISRVFIKCSIFLVVFAAVFCGILGSSGEKALGAAFDMEENLVIPTNKTQITLRVGPGFLYPVKRTLTDCEKLEVLEKGLWYKVNYEGDAGYVYSSLFLDEKGFAANRLDGIYIGIDIEGNYDFHSGVSWYGQINLAIAEKLKEILEDAGAVVVMPRNSFENEELGRDTVRAEIFNRYNCDIIYQIDSSSSPMPSQSGPQLRVALGAECKRAAEILAERLGTLSGHTDVAVTELEWNEFLNSVKSPAISISPGYLTNDLEWERLHTEAYQEAIARAIREFTVDYIYEYRMDGGSVTGDL